MQRFSRPSPAASRTRQRERVAASRRAPAQRGQDLGASWVVRVLTAAAVAGGVLHFLECFLEPASPPAVRPASSQGSRSHGSERLRAAVPLPAPVADSSTGVRAGQADRDRWNEPDTAAGLADEPDGLDPEALTDGRDPPGYDTGIVITPVAAAARFEKDEPSTEAARLDRAQPDIVAAQPQSGPNQSEPSQPEPAHHHLDPALDTGIVVMPVGYPASTK